MSLRDKILGAKDCPLLPVEVKEWGTTVYLKRLSSLERSKLSERWRAVEGPNRDNPRQLLMTAAFCLCDEDGTRLFDPDNDTELDTLGSRDGGVIEMLHDRAMEHNGLGGDVAGN